MCEFTSAVYLSFIKTLAGTYAVRVRNPKNLPETVIIPPTYNGIAVTKIAYKGFYGCASLKNIILPESIVEIDRNAFGNSGVESVTLPEGNWDLYINGESAGATAIQTGLTGAQTLSAVSCYVYKKAA